MTLNQVEEFLLSTPINSSNCVIVQDIKNNDVNKRLKRDLHEYTLMISCFCSFPGSRKLEGNNTGSKTKLSELTS